MELTHAVVPVLATLNLSGAPAFAAPVLAKRVLT